MPIEVLIPGPASPKGRAGSSREVARPVTLNGFTATMGTGIPALGLVVLWPITAYRTLRSALNRSLFFSPCWLSGAIPAEFEADAA